MSEQPRNDPPQNDDSCEELLQAWGARTPGELPRGLKGRVLQRMTARSTARYPSAFALAACLLVCVCLSALWWGRENPPEVKLAVVPPTPPSPPVSVADIQQQIASLGAELRRTELEARIEKQEVKLRKLQELLTNQRLAIDRAQVRKEVVSEWLASRQ